MEANFAFESIRIDLVRKWMRLFIDQFSSNRVGFGFLLLLLLLLSLLQTVAVLVSFRMSRNRCSLLVWFLSLLISIILIRTIYYSINKDFDQIISQIGFTSNWLKLKRQILFIRFDRNPLNMSNKMFRHILTPSFAINTHISCGFFALTFIVIIILMRYQPISF